MLAGPGFSDSPALVGIGLGLAVEWSVEGAARRLPEPVEAALSIVRSERLASAREGDPVAEEAPPQPGHARRRENRAPGTWHLANAKPIRAPRVAPVAFTRPHATT
jgi:hypothetical protein